MSNVICKYRFVLFMCLIPFGCIAGSDWNLKEAHMQCGPAIAKVIAECKTDQKNSPTNICKNYKLEITNVSGTKVFQLPYMPEGQRKILEDQGYTFNNVVKPGDWAPSMMKCYDNENIVIGYQLGLDEEESVKGSLLSYVDAPFFNLSGDFITGKKSSDLRAREIKDPYDNTNLDFISNR
jgi:hypothetical protein